MKTLLTFASLLCFAGQLVAAETPVPHGPVWLVPPDDFQTVPVMQTPYEVGPSRTYELQYADADFAWFSFPSLRVTMPPDIGDPSLWTVGIGVDTNCVIRFAQLVEITPDPFAFIAPMPWPSRHGRPVAAVVIDGKLQPKD